MDFSNLIRNIDALATSKGISRSKALLESGAGKDFAVNIEKKSQTPSLIKVTQLANYFNVSIDYLLGKTDDPRPLPKSFTDRLIPYEPDKMVPIPLIGRVAAGLACHAESNIEEYILTDTSSLNDGYDHIWLKVKGDSMEPMLLEGDLILVRIQSTAESGDYAVVIIDGEDGVVKRIRFEKNRIVLISNNREYPPRVFEKEEMNEVRIFGKVIESKRSF